MHRICEKALCGYILISCIATYALAGEDHTWKLSARARLADLQTGDQSGKAASLLLRGQVESQWADPLSTLLEVDYVHTEWQSHHSDGARNNAEPLIPDVPGGEINQLLLSYEFDRAQVKLGRQRIELDDQRFVGSNGYWQNDQTFDAISTDWKLFSASRLHYSYIANANRIFGDDADRTLPHDATDHYGSDGYRPAGLLGDHEHNSHLLHLQLNEWDFSRVIGYAYFIDNQDAPETSNQTLGGKYKFTTTAGMFKYQGELAAATQERTELPSSPRPIYALIDLNIIRGQWRLAGRHEVLGSDDNASFITPLGSNHNFQGMADVFATTPENGLEDNSLRVNWRSSPWELDIHYHWFSEYSGSQAYGEELDLDAEFKISRRHSLLLRYADFRTSSAYRDSLSDQRKIYLDYSFNF